MRITAIPLLVIHHDRFVGDSIAPITHAVSTTNPGSVVVSVDPGLPLQGIERPLDHALALMSRFGLQGSHIAVTGYSLEKNLGEEAAPHRDWEQVLSDFERASACEEVLSNLRALGSHFHVAIVDG